MLTDAGYGDTLTDRRNRFYNLSNSICYSYGTDNETEHNIITNYQVIITMIILRRWLVKVRERWPLRFWEFGSSWTTKINSTETLRILLQSGQIWKIIASIIKVIETFSGGSTPTEGISFSTFAQFLFIFLQFFYCERKMKIFALGLYMFT